jgi:hypothetical protein
MEWMEIEFILSFQLVTGNQHKIKGLEKSLISLSMEIGQTKTRKNSSFLPYPADPDAHPTLPPTNVYFYTVREVADYWSKEWITTHRSQAQKSHWRRSRN